MIPNAAAAAAAVHICCEIDILADHAALFFRIFTKRLSAYRYVLLTMSLLRVTQKI
jgi:hypothetical protein